MTSTVYALANGEYLVISAAGIRTHVRAPRTIEPKEFGPPRHHSAAEVATDFRDLADAIERAGNATAPIMAPGVYRSETNR
jgi:hypothetical protein